MTTRFLSALIFLMVLLAPGAQAYGETARTTLWFTLSSDIVEGARLIDKGDVAKGMALTRAALKQNLDLLSRATAKTNLCAGYLHLKLYRDAIKECGAVLKIRPSLWQALNNRGGANNGLGNYDAAIADYLKALKIRPRNESIHYNLHIAQNNKRLSKLPTIVEREG